MTMSMSDLLSEPLTPETAAEFAAVYEQALRQMEKEAWSHDGFHAQAQSLTHLMEAGLASRPCAALQQARYEAGTT